MRTRIRTPRHTPTAPRPRTRTRRRAALLMFASVAAVALVMATVPVSAQGRCEEPGQNMQCNDFGEIAMDTQRDIRGSVIDASAVVTLETSYFDQEARWIMFSVRNVTDDGGSPVTIALTSFSTPSGDVVTTRVEHPSPNELNLWVDTLDAPVGTPITIALQVGSTERGAFQLETLVMAFDRGYSPIINESGEPASLFSSTLLGVNKETGAVQSGGGSILDGHKLPGLEMVAVIAALAVVAAVVHRRRSN